MWEQFLEILKNAVQDNDFFSGGLVLGSMGALIAYFRGVPAQIWNAIKKQITTEIHLDNQNQIFEWIEIWLANHEYSAKTKHFKLTVHYRNKQQREHEAIEEAAAGKSQVNFKTIGKDERYDIRMVPAPGIHLIKHKGKWMLFNYAQERSNISNASGGGSFLFFYSMVISFIGKDKSIIYDIVREAQDLVHPKKTKLTELYAIRWDDWQVIDRKIARNPESLVFDNNLFEDLLLEINSFKQKEVWYQERGIPWRRGYLLYGPPGNGKTSIVTTLAGALEMNLYILALSAVDSDRDLLNILNSVPQGSIVLIEDIDTAFEQRKKEDDQSRITFSGLINAIDGAASAEGRILFMTTNRKERLDPALIRPGRADRHIFLDNATKTQAEKLFYNFFPEADMQLGQQFIDGIKDLQYSVAKLQDHLLRYSENPERAAKTPIAD